MIVAGALGATAGDTVSYLLGRRFGVQIIERWDFTRRHLGPKVERAQDYFGDHGGAAVFVGRFVGALRAVVPLVAGTAGMPFRRFFVWNVAASICWAGAVVSLGYFVGQRIADVIDRLGLWISLVAVALVAAFFAFRWWRRRRVGALHRMTGQHPAVDDELRAGAVRRLVGREEHHELGDLVGPADAGDGGPRVDRGAVDVAELGAPRPSPCRCRRGAPSSPGCRRARAPSPRTSSCPAPRTCVAVYAAMPGGADEPGRRRRCSRSTRRRRPGMRRRHRLHAEPAADLVHVDDRAGTPRASGSSISPSRRMPALLISTSSRPYARPGRVDRGLPLGRVGDVEVDVGGGVAEVGRHPLAEVVEHVPEHDPCTLGDEQLRLGLALTPGRAGDQRDLAVEPAFPSLIGCTRPRSRAGPAR